MLTFLSFRSVSLSPFSLTWIMPFRLEAPTLPVGSGLFSSRIRVRRCSRATYAAAEAEATGSGWVCQECASSPESIEVLMGGALPVATVTFGARPKALVAVAAVAATLALGLRSAWLALRPSRSEPVPLLLRFALEFRRCCTGLFRSRLREAGQGKKGRKKKKVIKIHGAGRLGEKINKSESSERSAANQVEMRVKGECQENVLVPQR